MTHVQTRLIAIFTALAILVGPALAAAQNTNWSRRAALQFVWFSTAPNGQAVGGTSSVEIRVSPNDRALPSVGVMEQYPGATGNKWQTSAWLAAFNASEVLGHDLTDHEFTVKAYGNIDGPSAGMLMTSTMMALLTNAPILPGTTMTGTVNPDGSAGPVGGIAQKLRGAKASGITRFGYPYGQRFMKDENTGRKVDLHRLGQGLGIQVVPITNLHEAYTFLTGRQLLRSLPASARDMSLQPILAGQVNTVLAKRKSRYQRQQILFIAQTADIDDKLKAEVAPLTAKAQNFASAAKRFEKAGHPAAAYHSMTQATILYAIARRLVPLTAAVNNKQDKALLAQVDKLKKGVDGLPQLGRTLDQHGLRKGLATRLSSAAAMQSFVAANAFGSLGHQTLEAARTILNDPKSTDDKKAAARIALVRCVAYFTQMEEKIAVSHDDLTFQHAPGLGGSIVSSNRSESNLGKAYASASVAAMEHFDSIFINPESKKSGIAKAILQELFTNQDPLYALGWHAAHMAAGIAAEGGSGSLLRLAAGSFSYTGAAHLLDRYYVVQYKSGPNGVMVQNPTVLAAQLTEARNNALESAGAARWALGFVPAPVRVAFDIAQANEMGTTLEQVEALRQYRLATFWARTARSIKG